MTESIKKNTPLMGVFLWYGKEIELNGVRHH